MVSMSATVAVPGDVVYTDLKGEAVILNIATGQYYGLDEVGASMWRLLTTHGKVDACFRSMLDEYEVSAEQLQHDLLDFVGRLTEQGLLDVRND
jgi:hypothetical protein